MDIDLQIEGILDHRVADAIRRRVRTVRRQFTVSGEWRVTVWPSDTRGEWDVGVRAPSGWHLDSFRDTIDGLPAFVEHRLREYVQLPDSDTGGGSRSGTSTSS